MSNATISHKGIVSGIKENRIEISIISESACASCKSKKVCSISEIKEKTIFIDNPDIKYEIGENVNVYIKESMGAYAVFFAYGLPFILMVSVLFLGYFKKFSEPFMGLSVILLLTIYYTTLYFLKDQIGKKVIFKVERPNKTDKLNNY